MYHIDFNIDENIENQFDEISKNIFNETLIIINRQKYYITEIEFYVHHSIKHPDPFTHKDDLQLTNNKWYFHGSGLDITIGDILTETYGGILIRGIKKVSKTTKGEFEYFDGPLNILKELFKYIYLEGQNQKIGLVKSLLIKNEIVKSNRIGLNPKGKKFGEVFKNKKYRYIIDLTTQHKYKEKGKVISNHKQIG